MDNEKGKTVSLLCSSMSMVLSVASPVDMKHVSCENIRCYYLTCCFVSLAKVKVARCLGIPNPLAGQSVCLPGYLDMNLN